MNRRFICFLLSTALAAPVFAETGEIKWGAQLSEKYNLWGWISAYTDEDADSWEALTGAERSGLTKKAEAACQKAGERSASTKDQTDGEAILRLSAPDINEIGACMENGGSLAAGLRGKKQRLALIKQKAAEGRFDQDDLDWLTSNGLTLQHEPAKAADLVRDNKARAEQQKKAGDKVGRKYGALKEKDLDANGLSRAYDGSALTGAGGNGSAAVHISEGNVAKNPLAPQARTPQKKLTYAPPPEMELTEEFKGMKGYSDMKKENTYNKVIAEVDKDGIEAAAKNKKLKSAGYATLKSVYSVSKDFDETFVNNPSPKPEDVKTVIDRIKSKAKNPDEAWLIAYQMRTKRDFPALRDAEHYLWACSEASDSRWKATRTLITTPLYSAAKLPGLRSIFFDENTSPPSASEIGWGWKGVTDCVK